MDEDDSKVLDTARDLSNGFDPEAVRPRSLACGACVGVVRPRPAEGKLRILSRAKGQSQNFYVSGMEPCLICVRKP